LRLQDVLQALYRGVALVRLEVFTAGEPGQPAEGSLHIQGQAERVQRDALFLGRGGDAFNRLAARAALGEAVPRTTNAVRGRVAHQHRQTARVRVPVQFLARGQHAVQDRFGSVAAALRLETVDGLLCLPQIVGEGVDAIDQLILWRVVAVLYDGQA